MSAAGPQSMTDVCTTSERMNLLTAMDSPDSYGKMRAMSSASRSLAEVPNAPPERSILASYYLFGAVAWYSFGSIFGASSKELGRGLLLSGMKAIVWFLPAVVIGRWVLREPLGRLLGIERDLRP